MPPRFFSALFVGLCLLAGTGRAAAPAARPVTVPELCLLLHGGYTGDEVLRQTAGRPLLAPLDDQAEQILRAAGADARLLAALRADHPPLSAAEADAARQQQALAAARDAQGRAASQARVQAAATSATLAVANAATPAAGVPSASPATPETLGRLAGAFTGKLVACRDGRLQPCAADAMNRKHLFAFYYAAADDAPSQEFTPRLLKFYQDYLPKHPEFEVVFVSRDATAALMENHMRQAAMPWPALAFENRAREPHLMALDHGHLPSLVVMDSAGRVVSDSSDGGNYLGVQHVLDDLATVTRRKGK